MSLCALRAFSGSGGVWVGGPEAAVQELAGEQLHRGEEGGGLRVPLVDGLGGAEIEVVVEVAEYFLRGHGLVLLSSASLAAMAAARSSPFGCV
jgi:hypothetical protein